MKQNLWLGFAYPGNIYACIYKGIFRHIYMYGYLLGIDAYLFSS